MQMMIIFTEQISLKDIIQKDIRNTLYCHISAYQSKKRVIAHPASITINTTYPRISIVVERCFHINKHKPVENYAFPLITSSHVYIYFLPNILLLKKK